MILRALFFVLVLVPFLIVGIPAQFVVTRLNLPFWNTLPRLFHRLSRVFLGLKVDVIGAPAHGRPTLLVSNHVSWTDIVALGSVSDVTFVAKSEIAAWPFVGFMASLQKTIFVDRKRKTDARRTSGEIAKRMADGRAVLLFAEGQSDIGTHVLPFRSALIGAAQSAMRDAGAKNVAIQPVTIAYTKLQGLPIGRNERNRIAWIKSKSIPENIRDILGGSTKNVTIAFGSPVTMDDNSDRKQMAQQSENQVRAMLVALNRGLPFPSEQR